MTKNSDRTSRAPSSRARLDADLVIARLKRLQALEIQSARLIGGWIPGVARWETKHQMARHAWDDACASKELRTRLWELRISNPDRDLGPDIGVIMRGLASAQADYEFLTSLYLIFKAQVIGAYEHIASHTSEVLDAPTITILRRLLPEKKAQLEWAQQEIPSLVDSGEKHGRVTRWEIYVRELLAVVGGVLGDAGPPMGNTPITLPPGYGTLQLPFAQAKRDSRFTVNLRGMALPEEDDVAGQVLYQFFNYTQEMQAVETLGSLLWETDGMEWEFYYDLARHCYDEERHSAMGEMRLKELGHDVAEFTHTVANYGWRQLVDPLRRYCVLTHVIETDSFKYKHKTYQQHLARGDMESAESVLWDIMDETLHVLSARNGCRCSCNTTTIPAASKPWSPSAGRSSWKTPSTHSKRGTRSPKKPDQASTTPLGFQHIPALRAAPLQKGFSVALAWIPFSRGVPVRVGGVASLDISP